MKLLRYLKNLIETNKLFSLIFDFIASTFFYQKIIKTNINKTITNLKKNKNYNITIETTNFCNAQCSMCPHRKMKRHQTIMDKSTFETIISKIISEKIQPQVFILNGFGEPLTDPNIINRIKYIKKYFPNVPIKFYSNFYLATSKIIKQLISSGLDEINISLNGYNASNYKTTMGLKYSQTIKNLKTILSQRKQLNSNIKIRISMTLISQNKKQVNEFIKKWQPLVDSVSVNKVHSYNQSVKLKKQKFKINFKKNTFPCKNIWNSLVFDVEGNLVICCLDYESKYKFGNIRNKSILSSFYSTKFNKIRKLHFQSKIKNIPICQQCYTPYKNGVEWLISQLY